MFKTLFLSILLVSSLADPNFQFDDIIQFLTGFNDQLNIESQKDLDKCTQVPLVKDVTKLIDDLKAPSPDPFNLVQDILNLREDYVKIKGNCPAVLKNYENFFSKFADSVSKNTTQTLLQVTENVVGHLTTVIDDAKTFEKDIKANDFNGAGAELGTIVQIALAGYL